MSHPEQIPKIPKYRKFFADMDVPFTPVSFIGEYEGQRYPYAYRTEEKEMLGLNAEDGAGSARSSRKRRASATSAAYPALPASAVSSSPPTAPSADAATTSGYSRRPSRSRSRVG